MICSIIAISDHDQIAAFHCAYGDDHRVLAICFFARFLQAVDVFFAVFEFQRIDRHAR